MADPCIQGPAIATLQANTMAIGVTLHEIKQGQQRFIEVLESIAIQGEQIKSLSADVLRNERGTNELFVRVHNLETQPVKEASIVRTGAIQAFVSAVIAIIVSLIAKGK